MNCTERRNALCSALNDNKRSKGPANLKVLDMRKFLSPYWLWVVLAFPGVGMATQLCTSSDSQVIHNLLHPTDAFAARFMIIAMLASPLVLLLKAWRGPQWLKKNRRYFGVAAFAYALAHTVFYLIDIGTLGRILSDVPKLYIWTGWIAFIIFVPLAMTSSDFFLCVMGPNWKRFQHWIYAAAVLPLGLLETYRVWYLRPRQQRAIKG